MATSFGTSFGPSLSGLSEPFAAGVGQIPFLVPYAVVFSLTSALLGAYVIPRLVGHPSSAPCPDCPPCACLCASTCVPAPAS
jgi:hypothetical protein